MAIAPSPNESGPAISAFAETLNGLAVGIVSLDFARCSLAATLAGDNQVAPGLQSLLVQAWDDGRLSAEDYEALVGELGNGLREDDPTEWSEEIVSEMAPTSDTVRRPAKNAQASAEEAQPPTLFPGAVLRDRFVLQARLAASGMSEVYKALDRRRQEAGADNPWVAIKLVGPSTRRYRDALRLLQQEASLAQRLDHPNIVRVFDFDRDGDHAFITMEWLEGESLAELLTRQRHRPLTSAHARQILAEIGDALQFAHSRAITHADIKPGNIFLTRDGAAKLLDFGIARAGNPPPGATDPDARTPAYASCEVLEGQPATPQDDVYSIACVVYRMLAGHRVFGHEDALAAERAGRQPARIRRIADAQWQALERALAFRREARTADVARFLQEFNAPAMTMPTTTPALAATAASTVAPAGLRPAWIALAAGIALIALAATLWRGPVDAPPEILATAGPVSNEPRAPVGPPRPEPAAAAPAPAPKKSARTPAPASTARTLPPQPNPQPNPPARPEAPQQTTPPAAATASAAAAEPPPPPAPPVRDPALPAGGVPVPAAGVAVNGNLPAPPAPATAATAAAAPAAAPPVASPPAPEPEPVEPKEVGLSALSFRRYVEPKDRRRTIGSDPVGWVELHFIVDAQGETRNVTVTDASPAGRYEEAALTAVRRWRFEPVIENGKPVERRTAVRLRFQPE